MLVKTAHINLLEEAIVSLSAGTADPSYPLGRLYDRNVGRDFRATAAATIEVKVDQGAAGAQAIDRLIIPPGHNLEGMTLDIKHSSDDAVYTPATAQWQGAEGLIEKSWAPVVKRFWKFIITAPTTVPSLAELFLTSTYEWEKNPTRPYGPFEDVHNTQNPQTSGGRDRFLVLGPPKRHRPYEVARAGESQKDEMEALYGTYIKGRPFWLCDNSGDWIYGKLQGGLDLTEVAYQRYRYSFDFIEVIP